MEGKPNYEIPGGLSAVATARLVIVATLCVFQYWLLTSTFEAYRSGDRNITLPAFLASAACFLLAAGLVVTGEITTRKIQEAPK
jgi:hypothetical protein